MITDRHDQRTTVADYEIERAAPLKRNPAGRTAADAARSAKNIGRWKAYLPDDCIDTMIAMGWDLST